jgi:hypothetical protein
MLDRFGHLAESLDIGQTLPWTVFCVFLWRFHVVFVRRIVKGLARQSGSTLKWKLEKQYFGDKPLMGFQFFWCIWDFLILLNIGKDCFEENVHKIYNLCQDRQRRGSLDCWRLDQRPKVAKTFWKMPKENWKPSQQLLSLIRMTIKMLPYV